MPYKDREVRLEYLRQWRTLNKEKFRSGCDRWAKENPERHRELARNAQRRWRDRHPEQAKKAAAEARVRDPEKYRAIACKHVAAHRDRINALARARRKFNRERRRLKEREQWDRQYRTKPGFRIAQNLRTAIRSALKRAGGKRTVGLVALLGCSIPELIAHLEAKFEPGMSWADRGAWHIDHIRPCASFDLTSGDQQRLAFHYTNLQPLWALDNLRKGAIYRCPEVGVDL